MVYQYATYPSLHDKVVLITGGAEGIGAATVELFCRQGSKVHFIDISDSSSKTLLEKIKKEQPDAPTPTFHHGDVTDLARLQAIVKQILDENTTIDVLINNAAAAGGHARIATPDVTQESWDFGIAVNLRHFFFLTQAIVSAMIRKGSGSIINMGSVTWRIPSAGMPVYATCKAAILGLTRTHSKEFGEQNIRVNSVMPGSVATQRQWDEVWTPNPEYREEIHKAQSLKRDTTPEEIGRTVLFLASDDASGITGSSYCVDGGWVGDP